MKPIINKYLEINYPQFISKFKPHQYGVVVESHVNSDTYNQVILDSVSMRAPELKQLLKDIPGRFSLSVSYESLMNTDTEYLIAHGWKPVSQENWFLLNAEEHKVKFNPPNITHLNAGNWHKFEGIITDFFTRQQITKTFLDTCKNALFNVAEGNLFSTYLIIEDNVVKATGGFILSPKTDFAYINFVLTDTANLKDNQELFRYLASRAQELGAKSILIINEGSLVNSFSILNMGFELQHIMLTFKRV